MTNAVENLPTTMPIPKPVSESAAIISMVERMARDPAVDVDKLRQILQLRLEVEARENQRAFDQALTEAQAEMEPVRRDASNPQTRSKYATLFAVDSALRPYYSKHAIGITFDEGITDKPDCVRVICRVSCAGHRQEYHVDMPADGKGARGNDVMTKTHATGSAITYGRRYLMLMIFNVAVGGEDDDGKATGVGFGPVTPEQLKEIQNAIVNGGVDIKWLIAFINKKSDLSLKELAEIPANMHQNVLKAIAAKAKQSVQK